MAKQKIEYIKNEQKKLNAPPIGTMNHKRKILDETEPLASEKQTHSRLHRYVLCSKIIRQHIVTFHFLNITGILFNNFQWQ